MAIESLYHYYIIIISTFRASLAEDWAETSAQEIFVSHLNLWIGSNFLFVENYIFFIL